MGSINIPLLTERIRLDHDLIANRQETIFADAAHHHQMFGFGKWPVFLTMFDDSLREAFTDTRQGFEFLSRGRIDVDSRPTLRGG